MWKIIKSDAVWTIPLITEQYQKTPIVPRRRKGFGHQPSADYFKELTQWDSDYKRTACWPLHAYLTLISLTLKPFHSLHYLCKCSPDSDNICFHFLQGSQQRSTICRKCLHNPTQDLNYCNRRKHNISHLPAYESLNKPWKITWKSSLITQNHPGDYFHSSRQKYLLYLLHASASHCRWSSRFLKGQCQVPTSCPLLHYISMSASLQISEACTLSSKLKLLFQNWKDRINI